MQKTLKIALKVQFCFILYSFIVWIFFEMHIKKVPVLNGLNCVNNYLLILLIIIQYFAE